jgi:hypothetical protein
VSVVQALPIEGPASVAVSGGDESLVSFDESPVSDAESTPASASLDVSRAPSTSTSDVPSPTEPSAGSGCPSLIPRTALQPANSTTAVHDSTRFVKRIRTFPQAKSKTDQLQT